MYWSRPNGPTGARFDFGSSGPRSIAIEGNTAIIGAARATVGGNAEQGAVYVFTQSGAAWSAQAKLAGKRQAPPWPDLEVTSHSAATPCSPRAAAAALTSSRARARPGWSRQALELPDSPPSCGACPSVRTLVGGLAIDGNTAVVLGAPGEGGSFPHAAYSFRRVGTSWFLHEQMVASNTYCRAVSLFRQHGYHRRTQLRRPH